MSENNHLERPLRVLTPVHLTSKTPAWIADKDSFGRLLAEFESAALEMRDKKLASTSEFTLNYEREAIERQWTPDFHIVERNPDRDLYGSASAVMAAVDSATVSRLEVSCGEPFADRMSLKMNGLLRFYDDEAVALTVAAEDAAWARKWHASLAQHVRRGRPWWWWLRAPDGGFAFCLTVSVLVLMGLVGLLDVSLTSSADIVAVVVAGAIYGPITSVPMALALRRLLPSLQVLRMGETDRGNRAIAIISAPVLAIAWNVAAWFITR